MAAVNVTAPGPHGPGDNGIERVTHDERYFPARGTPAVSHYPAVHPTRMENEVSTDKDTDPIAQIEELEALGIEELRLAREADAKAEAAEQQAAAIRAKRRAELEERFSRVEAEKTRLAQVKAATDAFEAAKAQYTKIQQDSDRKYAQTVELQKQLGDALVAAVPAELARLAAGEQLRAAGRALDALDPGRAKLPAVASKRLVPARDDSGLLGALSIAETAHPAIKDGLNQLKKFEGWRPPHYAYVMGKQILVP